MSTSKIIVTPLNGEIVLTRGRTSATPENLHLKLVYAAKRAPKYTLIRITLPDGVVKEFNRDDVEALAAAEGKTVPTSKMPSAKAKRSKVAKKKTPRKPRSEDGEDEDEETCSHGRGCKGHGHKFCNHAASLKRHHTAGKKPGVIATIIEYGKKVVDDGGATVQEYVQHLKKHFPDRPIKSMTTTVRCQLGRDLRKKKGVKIIVQRDKQDGRIIRYAVA